VPEDQSAVFPSQSDVTSGYIGTYFDCYSYQHLLNQVVNPTLARCLSDEFDANQPFTLQCLERQLAVAVKANCIAYAVWDINGVYAASTATTIVAVNYQGFAYISQFASGGNLPSQIPGSGNAWVSVGESIWSSWNPLGKYSTGDVVTYHNPTVVGVFTMWVVTGSPVVGTPPASGQWTNYYTSGEQNVSPKRIDANAVVLGTLPPFISFNSSTQLFTLNLDSYGFGGTQPTNADDGYLGNNDDLAHTPDTSYQQTLNSSFDDQARDSYGLTGTGLLFSTPPYKIARRAGQCFDERMILEGDDYFHSLFGNWPALRLLYIDAHTNLQTSYVRYLPQAANAGLSVPLPLPLFTPTSVATGYLPYGRVGGNQPYQYTFAQDYPSIGNMWQPVDAIVVTTSSVPLLDDQTMAPTIIGDIPVSGASANQGASQTKKILAEFSIKPNFGQEYRNEINFEPQGNRVSVDMKSATDLKQIDYVVNLRMKQSQILRPLSLSNGGNVNMRYIFERK